MKIPVKTFFLSLMLGLMAHLTFGQGTTTVSGKVVDASGEPVVGANIYIKETTTGTVTDLKGNFTLKTTKSGKQTIVISSVGMLAIEKEFSFNGQELELGTIIMESDAIGLVEVSVFANIAIDRKTPVPVANIQPEMIQNKLGMQEFPEIMKSTHGIYATKQGGAFGDSRVNIRGFNSRNSAVMINGVPVNDMENGWVYWSNWAGLSDVTRTMQVQRGLGAARIALPSVGGTINVLTKTTDAEKGGNVSAAVGNNGYNKVGVTLSSGLTEQNWATTISLSKTTGDGIVKGTPFESYSYYMNISKIFNNHHRLAFSLFGAPQWHGQRATPLKIDVYKHPTINDRYYNPDWGYKNGQMTHVRKNYYHKPMAILNHFWDVNENLNVLTAAYMSIGTGGGSGYLGNYKGYPTSSDPASDWYNSEYRREGLIDMDKIVAENEAAGASGSETILRNSVNNHFWTGFLSNVSYSMDWLQLSGGVDIRYYKGEHYREVEDLLGGEYFLENSDLNNPNKTAFVGDLVDYYNDGLVLWEGVFGQAEAEFGDLTAFVAGALSNKSYSRVEYFLEEHDGSGAQSPWYNFFGYSFKGGANYNLTAAHNVFFNAGHFTNQPDFRTIFYNYTNDANEDAPNEKVASFELGYGFRSGFLSGNVNAYYTTWKDKSRVLGYIVNGEDRFANLTGINARHQGVELDVKIRPIDELSITGMVSVGDWRWMNNVSARFFDDNNNFIFEEDVYIKDVHVGDAAQTTAALGISYELLDGLKLGANYNYYENLYADFDPEARTSEPTEGEETDSWVVPAYNLMDLYAVYNFKLGDYDASLVGNMNNVFDTEYISDAYDGPDHSWRTAEVYYGWGRTWMISLKLNF